MNMSSGTLQGALLMLGGLVLCFRGRALFRMVLPLVGFLLFAFAGFALARPHAHGDLLYLTAVAFVAGAVGAALLTAAYFYGLFLVGAAFGAQFGAVLAARAGYDPSAAMLLGGVIGGVATVLSERLLITLATSIWGAMFAVSGYLVMTGQIAADRFLDPSAIATMAQRADHAPLAWLLLAIAGLAIQARPQPTPVVVH